MHLRGQNKATRAFLSPRQEPRSSLRLRGKEKVHRVQKKGQPARWVPPAGWKCGEPGPEEDMSEFLPVFKTCEKSSRQIPDLTKPGKGPKWCSALDLHPEIFNVPEPSWPPWGKPPQPPPAWKPKPALLYSEEERRSWPKMDTLLVLASF